MDTSSISIAVEKAILRNEVEFYFEDVQKRVDDGLPAIAAVASSVGFTTAKSHEFRARCESIREGCA